MRHAGETPSFADIVDRPDEPSAAGPVDSSLWDASTVRHYRRKVELPDLAAMMNQLIWNRLAKAAARQRLDMDRVRR